MSILLITHDLGVVANVADHVAVMYLGKIVEYAKVRIVLKNPRHPYTQGLLRSLPRIGDKRRLVPIEGSVPDPFEISAGCAFAPRCPDATDRCREAPPLLEIGTGHQVSCWLTAPEGNHAS